MEKPGPEFFAEANIETVNGLIGSVATIYSAALGLVEAYQRQNDPYYKAAVETKMQGIVESSLPPGMKMGDMNVSVTPIPDGDESVITEAEFKGYLRDLETEPDQLVQLAAFLQEDGYKKITDLGLAEGKEALEMSWRSVWTRYRNVIKPLGGTVLADVGDMIDDVVRLKYPDSFDPTDFMRGAEAKADVSTAAFYEVFGPHLKRAIMRSGEDNWTGH